MRQENLFIYKVVENEFYVHYRVTASHTKILFILPFLTAQKIIIFVGC